MIVTIVYQNYWEPVSTVMLSTNDTKIGKFYESYKKSCAPNPVEDLNYQSDRSYFDDFLLCTVNSCTKNHPGYLKK